MNTTPMIPEIKSDTAATSITRADRKEKDGSFAQIFEVMKKDQASVQRDRVQKPEEKRDEPKSVKKKTKQESEGTTDAAPATEKHCEVHDQQQTSKDNDSQEKGQAAAYNKTLADSTTSTQSKGAGEATVSSKDLASSILHANQDLNLLVKLKDTSANSFQLLKTQSLSDGKNPAPLFDNKGKQAVELVHSNAKAAEKAELPVRVDEQIPTIEPESKTASEKSNAESTASVAAKNVETAQAPPIDKLDATAAFRDTLNQTRESGTAHRKDAATSEDAKAQSSQEMDAQAATQQVQKQGQAESADGKMGADTTKDAMSTFARRLTVDAAKSDTTNVENQKSPAEVPDLADLIVQRARLVPRNGQETIEIQLKPDILGKLFMRVEVVERLMNAEVTVQNHQVKNLLESQLQSLQNALEANGLKLNRITIQVADTHKSDQQSEGRQSDDGSHAQSQNDDPRNRQDDDRRNRQDDEGNFPGSKSSGRKQPKVGIMA